MFVPGRVTVKMADMMFNNKNRKSRTILVCIAITNTNQIKSHYKLKLMSAWSLSRDSICGVNCWWWQFQSKDIFLKLISRHYYQTCLAVKTGSKRVLITKTRGNSVKEVWRGWWKGGKVGEWTAREVSVGSDAEAKETEWPDSKLIPRTKRTRGKSTQTRQTSYSRSF